MLRRVFLIATLVALCAAIPASAAVWDIYADFGLTNPNGAWSYGFADYDIMSGPGFAMTLFDYTAGDLATGAVWTRSFGGPDYCPYIWFNPGGQGTYPANSVVFSSGNGGGAYDDGSYNNDPYTVIRWTAPAAGQYTVDASFKQMVIGSSWTGRMDCHVLVNGVSKFDCIVNGLPGDPTTDPPTPGDITSGPGPFTFTGVFDLAAGDTVDYCGGPYTWHYSDFVDVTGSKVTGVVPEPSSILALIAGMGGFIGMLRKRS